MDEELISTENEQGLLSYGEDKEKKTSFTVWDYAPEDFTAFTADGSVTETYSAIDAAGNVTKRQITVHVTDSAPKEIAAKGTTRFITEKYYNADEENGGLSPDSLWKTDEAYRALIGEAFSNEKNATPKESYEFSHDTILKMQEFVEANGIGNSKDEHALERFYEQFLAGNRQ